MVLKNNNFEFDERHFVQKLGTAIGTRMAPSYANIFKSKRDLNEKRRKQGKTGRIKEKHRKTWEIRGKGRKTRENGENQEKI